MKNKSGAVQDIIGKISLILKPEMSFYLISFIYGVGVSILTLAIPISVQSLVNTVSFGVLLQPLIVLSIVLLLLLLFSGVLNALQTYIIELFQRHFYARVTTDITFKLLNSKFINLKEINSVELVNRYFDVMTVQKSVITLLIGGIAVVLQSIVGLLLLAFYHPYFLVFDFLLIFLLYTVWAFFGKRALMTAVKESKSKYKVASWLEEIARGNIFFKNKRRRDLAIQKSDLFMTEYLTNRSKHFKFVFLQTIFLLTIYAIMSALILGLGGFLVINGQLTLGQLVGAELVITVILSSFSNSGKYLEAFYDLFAAVDKLSQFYDLGLENNTYTLGKIIGEKYKLSFNQVEVRQRSTTFTFKCEFEEGKNYHIFSPFHSTRRVFFELIQSIITPEKGSIELGDIPYDSLSPIEIRDNIYIVDIPFIFEGTVKENLTIGNKEITKAAIMDALDMVDLAAISEAFSEGLDTKLLPSGYPLWPSQMIRFDLARAILHRPKIVVLTSIFDHIDEVRRERVLKYFMNSDMTVILFSNKFGLPNKFDHYIFMDKDAYKVFDTKEELIKEGGLHL